MKVMFFRLKSRIIKKQVEFIKWYQNTKKKVAVA